MLFADNDFDCEAKENITGKIYNKRKKEYSGVRAYQANQPVRCYRYVHNNVDLHNQAGAYGGKGIRTRRKQMRVHN